MKIKLFVCVGVLFCLVFGSLAATPELQSWVEKEKELRMETCKRAASKLVKKIISTGKGDLQDSSSLSLLCNEMLRDIEQGDRAEIIQEFLGKESYQVIEKVYISQVASTDGLIKYDAIRFLGYIYSKASEKVLKEVFFGAGPYVQFASLVSLVKIGTPDSKDLLMSLVLSGTIPEEMISRAIEALLYVDEQMVADFAPEIMNRNPHIFTVHSVLPAIMWRKDSKEVLSRILFNYTEDIPDKNKLTMSSLAAMHINSDIMSEVEKHPKDFLKEERIMAYIEKYSKYNNQSGVYIDALLMLERSGREEVYFKKMLSDKNLTAHKRKVLELIIDRIQNDQRLEFNK